MADNAPKRGRRPKLTPDLALSIAAYVEEGNFREAAARAFQVSGRTINRWMRTGAKFPDGIYGEFRGLLLEAEGKAEINALRLLQKHAKEADPACIRFYLERRHHRRWGKYRSELEDVKRQLKQLQAERRKADEKTGA